MVVALNVAIEPGSDLLPFAELERLGGQPLSSAAFDLFEQRTPAGAETPVDARIERRQAFPDRPVHLGKREYLSLAMIKRVASRTPASEQWGSEAAGACPWHVGRRREWPRQETIPIRITKWAVTPQPPRV